MKLAIVMLCLYPNHAVHMNAGDHVYNAQNVKTHTVPISHDYCLPQEEDSANEEWPLDSIQEIGYYSFTGY